ncbi:conserved hypothetical protein [Edwardsiella phage PEi26]|uniref:Uncharacterized protein n=1 Tax=Edwardsiella phage PEi26 TaxID=1608311 RepID=A0A0B6VSZ7_9CAUD|nr:conserved hypothetical protein [Edwardsiella phage PEi26]
MTIQKLNNRIVVREACRETANRFRSPSDHHKDDFTDSKMVVKNHPSDVKPFVEQIRFSLNKDAFDHIGGVQAIMNRLPRLDTVHTYLCVYDFYKALRDSKYFAVDRALKRISQFGVRKEGMKFTRKNARGHFTSACSPTMKAYTQSFCSEFNYNWRMILTLGSRLCVGRSRELVFKTCGGIMPYIDAKMVAGYDNKFTVQVMGHAPDQAFAQLRAFLDAVNEDLLHYTFVGNTFTITVRQAQVKPDPIKTEPLSAEQKDFVLKGNWSNSGELAYFKIAQPEHTPIEEHFFKEMEKSVNEITLILDGYDRQIDELTSKADKMRAQRGKLLHAMQELRK